MEQEITFSIEESIQRLKAEIIAQDWRISPNRASQLEASFACLRQRFKSRKATHAMLVMAGSTLEHIKKKGGNPPETIDFLKEAMAHVVNLYEDLSYDPDREEQLFQKLFRRFNLLKEKIKQKKNSYPPASSVAFGPHSISPIAPKPKIVLPTTAQPAALPRTDIEPLDSTNVEGLINDLKATLEKAGEVGSAIGRVLEELLEKHAIHPPAQESAEPTPSINLAPDTHSPSENATNAQPVVPRIQSCPPTELKELLIHGKTIAIQATAISLIRATKKRKLALYLQNSNVPLKEFTTLFHGLANQFTGSLSQIQNNKLKQISLPLMTPEGSEWPETPDDQATTLVIISNGNWHGIIPCSSVCDIQGSMIKFEKQQNGDCAGIGYLDNGQQVELLDLQRILRREGFLVMV